MAEFDNPDEHVRVFQGLINGLAIAAPIWLLMLILCKLVHLF